jgi:hypothetical protein
MHAPEPPRAGVPDDRLQELARKAEAVPVVCDRDGELTIAGVRQRRVARPADDSRPSFADDGDQLQLALRVGCGARSSRPEGSFGIGEKKR